MKLNEYINEKLIISKDSVFTYNDFDNNILTWKEFLKFIKEKSKVSILKTNYINIIENYMEMHVNDHKNKYYKKLDKGEIETDEILDQIGIELINKNFQKLKHIYANDIKIVFQSTAINFGIYMWQYWGPDDLCKFIYVIDYKNKTSDVFEVINNK